MPRAITTLCFVALLLSPNPSASQLPQPGSRVTVQGPGARRLPLRDREPERTGTALVRGRVVAADTGAPLRRVQIRAVAADIRESRIAITDPDGRYELKDLPAGRYSLTASKGGYVTVQYGQRRTLEAGRPLEIADGQKLDQIDFLLPRGGVLTGRLVDEYGEPMAEAIVQAMRYRYVGGRRQLMGAGRPDQTNDIGEFRIFGLSPGDYYLAASLRPGPAMAADLADTMSYAPTYYPGTPSATEAQAVTLGLGQELAGLGFALIPARQSRLTGLVTDSTSRPLADGVVTITQDQAIEGGGMLFLSGRGGRIGNDGSFTISGVAPGSYTLRVNADGPDDEGEFAVVPVTVAGEDLSGIVIRTTPGATLSGVIEFEGGSAPSGGAGRLRVTAMPVDPSIMVGPMRGGSGTAVRDNQSFEIRGLWGRRLIRLSEPPAGWYLKQVLLDDVDVTDEPLDFNGSEAVEGLRIVLTTQTTTVAGTVTDDRGRAALDYVVVVFSEDSRRWGFQSRSVRSARPDQTGTFQISGLPPGDYLAVAATAVEDGAWTDPDFLEQLRPLATRVSVGTGASRSLTLKMATVP